MQNYHKILKTSILIGFLRNFLKKIKKYVKNILKLLVNEKVLCYNKFDSKKIRGKNMKIFDKMQNFFESLGLYIKGFSNLFWIFVGAFLAISVIVIIITSFAYECKLTKTVDKINKFFERNPRINDDNLVAFNNMMKASSVPKTLRRQWQQFMLYREHPASYYMSFQHCVENPLRNSAYRQQMTVYKIISYVLVVLSLIVSSFMATSALSTSYVLQDVLIIPITILVAYWLISLVLDLIHSAISGDLFQNYQYFEINIDKAMLTLPEFVDYEVLFSQDEIRRGIPVLFAYLQKRAIQEQQELEKARLKSVDHEKFDFNVAGLDGSLVLDRAMRETENFSTQRKKYMQETERVNNEIAVLENNYREQTKEFQRQVQTSKETVENLKEQLEQANSTIEINYIKKQIRDEINREQLAEKEFDILTDKHNQAIKSLNQEIKHYDEETKKAKEALEVAMLSEFNTYSVKVYDNLEKIVDDKMQEKVDDYKEQIKGLEIELEEKNEELENVYTRYQEVLAQVPTETTDSIVDEPIEELPAKKSKKKKKSKNEPDEGFVQPEQVDYYDEVQPEYSNIEPYTEDFYQGSEDYSNQTNDEYNIQNYDNDQQYNDVYNNLDYVADNSYQQEQYDENQQYYDDQQYVNDYVPLDNENDYTPLQEDNYYVPLQEEGEYVGDYSNETYVPTTDYTDETYMPQTDYNNESFDGGEYVPLAQEEKATTPTENFDDADFDVDFTTPSATTENFEDMDFDFDFGEEKPQQEEKPVDESEDVDDGDFDLNKILGLYEEPKKETPSIVEDAKDEDLKVSDDEDVYEEIAEEEIDDAEEELDEELEKPITKRKVGRPRKIVEEDEIKPKRKPGRPRKIVEDADVAPKRKPGRPRKAEVLEESVLENPKRKAGRPKKVINIETKRTVGRPRKVEIETPTAKRGRPRKDAVKVVEEKTVKSTPKRGRPKKVEKVERRGRPRKTAVLEGDVLQKPKRKPGRPRKNS